MLASCPVSRSEWFATGYLTIQESVVEDDNTSQRRGGVHTETPGSLAGRWRQHACSPSHVPWGLGLFDQNDQVGEYLGGIFFSSNVSHSSRVWNLQIREPEHVRLEEIGWPLLFKAHIFFFFVFLPACFTNLFPSLELGLLLITYMLSHFQTQTGGGRSR